ncbi:50S ribosomal protein L13 [Candidatus Bathyarchaeota archaeon]|nr:50S ribosomal protein L13 [Candidatus Bathyarchaeota archaeon]
MSSHNDLGVVFNAEGLILGRVASVVARTLLSGATVSVVNAEKAVVSGKRSRLVRRWKDFLKVKSMANPRKYGPFHSRRPDTILHDAIRGMLPTNKARGRSSLRRLKVHISVPEFLKESPMETIPEASSRNLKGRFVMLGDLAAEIGWKRRRYV